MLPRRIPGVIVFSFFMVLFQLANINLMTRCLLLMQNLPAQNLLLTRSIGRPRKRYPRRAPYYKGLAKDRYILMDIVEIRTGKIGRPRRDLCPCEMRT